MTNRVLMRLAELVDRKPVKVEIDGQPVCVALVDGQVFAVGDICSHANVSLSEGEIDGHDIECWLHGSRFNLRTGTPDSPPAVVAIPTYSVTMVDDLAVIEGKK
ncbi:MAG TPA: non-heme iron oxygenase ferredoxin subunit [Candidatus Nanopelagicaceae bacterium]|nr:non-heme iron oxygenase ferredoxin subunit [Candidatus Nanopelagicaceae bacterium]